MQARFTPVFLLLGLLLPGCQSEPMAGGYVPPSAGSPVATVRGCLVRGTGFLEGNHEARVRFVDMLQVPERGEPERAVTLSAGSHRLLIVYSNSGFHSQVELPLEAVAGGDYRVGIRSIKDPAGDERYCEFWIEDALTGKVLSEVARRRVSGAKPKSIFSAVD